MPLTPNELFDRLAALGIATQTVGHPPLRTVEESRALRGAIPGGHTKNLFLKDKKGNVFLVVAEEDATIDLKRVHETIGAQGRVSFGSAELLMDLLGVAPGAVTPFALVNDTAGRVRAVIDAALVEHDVLNFHPLDNTMTTSIATRDLLRFLEAQGHAPAVLRVSEAAPARAGGG